MNTRTLCSINLHRLLKIIFFENHYIDSSYVLFPERAIFDKLERLRRGLLPTKKLLLDSEKIFRKLESRHYY